jgi:hypothetical protein
VLIVPSDRLDFVQDKKHLSKIVAVVQERLRGDQGLLFE